VRGASEGLEKMFRAFIGVAGLVEIGLERAATRVYRSGAMRSNEELGHCNWQFN
jgi:hypothetical protein